MSSWVFLAGATALGALNASRRFAVYNTVAQTTEFTPAFPTASANNLGVGPWCRVNIIGSTLYVAPVPEQPNPLTPLWYNYVHFFNLSNLSSAFARVLGYDWRNVQTKLLGATHFLFKDYPSEVTSVYRVNEDGSLTLFSEPLTSTLSGRRAFVSANNKLYIFYVENANFIRYRMSSNGVSWTTHDTTGASITTYINYDSYADLSATYGCALARSPAVVYGSFTSDGGSTWTSVSNVPSVNITHVIATAAGVHIVVNGTNIYRTTNGTTWTDLGQPLSGETIYNIVYGNSMYMIVGSTGSAATTTDFNSFTSFTAVDFELQNVYGAVFTTAAVGGVIDPPVLTLFTLPNAVINVPYTNTLGTVANGKPPLVWSGSVTNPGGSSVYTITSATLAHTFVGLGTHTVSATVTDDLGRTSTKTTTVLVTDGGGTSALSLALTNPLPGATVNVPYSASVGAASGGTPPYSWALTTKSWADAASLSNTGVLTTTFTLAGAETLTVTVTDSSTPTQSLARDTGLTVAANTNTATIQGTLRLDTSNGPFAARDVYLYNYVNGEKIAETVSDGITGVWQFTQVAPGEYFVVGVAQGTDLTVPRDFDALGVITVV